MITLKLSEKQRDDLYEEMSLNTVNQAIQIIFEETGVRLKHSACQSFLKKIGLKCRRCGLVPSKAMDDEKQCEAQQVFHDQKLQLLLDEAKQGKRTVLFVDAAHFVMGSGTVTMYRALPAMSGSA